MVFAKTELFESGLRELSVAFKAMSHPARLAILKYLAETNSCFTGDITEFIPLGRTTVNQHLAELKNAGLIQGTISGSKTSYCLDPAGIEQFKFMTEKFIHHI